MDCILLFMSISVFQFGAGAGVRTGRAQFGDSKPERAVSLDLQLESPEEK